MKEDTPHFSGSLSKAAPVAPDRDDEPAPPPFRSHPWPTRVQAVMTKEGMALHVHLTATQLRELADAAGNGDIAVHVHALDDDAEEGAP